MVRKDVKEKLLDKDLDNLFLKHREIDQGNYRVGEIDGEIICWNPDTDEFMDYFYDDSEDDWYSFDTAFKSFGKDYKINRKSLEIIGPRGKMKIYNQTDDTYPSVHIKKFNSSYNCPIHRLLALLFIPRFNDSYDIVDHIDRDKLNHSLSNLRWVSQRINALNRDKKLFIGNNVYIAFSDKEKHNKRVEFTEEGLYNRYSRIIINAKNRIRNASVRNIKYDGWYWSVVNMTIVQYLDGDDIDETEWVDHYSGEFQVHPLGIIRIKYKSREYITIGSIKGSGKYKLRYFKKRHLHRIVAEVFLNNNSPISGNLVVDHLDSNTLNNRVSNLKICTQKENLSNPNYSLRHNRLNTIEIDGVIYKSYVEASKQLNISRCIIRHRVLSKSTYPNYKLIK
jgi:hypothetical protein